MNRSFVNPVMVEAFVKAAGDKFFTITFEKKDGRVRVLNGRRGVTKYLKGTSRHPKKKEF